MGTVAYMSPEQVRGGFVDHRTDIFSFGTVLYEMLAGELPFVAESSVETMNAILKNEPRDLDQQKIPIQPALERILRRCLEKNPAERFQSASDLAFALETISGATGSDASAHISKGRISHRRWIAISALLLGFLIAIALLIPRVFRASSEQGILRFPVSIPESVNFLIDVETHNLSISPDGRRIAFVGTSKGQRMIWIRPLDSLVAEPVEGTQGAISPIWSPDSRFIAFFAEGKLKKINATGGSPQSICNLASGAQDRIGAWAQNGTILFSEEGDNAGIYGVSAEGGTASLFIPSGDLQIYWIDVLPDSKHFLIVGGSEEKQTEGIYVGEFGSSDRRMLIPIRSRVEYAEPGFLLYVREGALVAHRIDTRSLRLTGEPFVVVDRIPNFDKTGWAEFSVSEAGVLTCLGNVFLTELVWYDRGGRELATVGSRNPHYGVRLSPDGQRLAIGISDRVGGSGDIWIQDLNRGTSTRFAFGSTDDTEPVWSPDSKELAFFSCCEDKSTLHIKSTNEMGNGRMPLEAGFHVPDDWSLNGQYILYREGEPTGNHDLWVLPLSHGEKPFVFLQSQFNEGLARFSPDGKWVAYVSNESGQDDVYVARFENSREKWRISSAGGTSPRWRRDGKELFYLAADGKFMAVPVKSVDSFEPGVPFALFRMEALLQNDYDVTADGQRFLINRTITAAQALPFHVIVNWHQAEPAK
jgi:Tol biopolymer transport system component